MATLILNSASQESGFNPLRADKGYFSLLRFILEEASEYILFTLPRTANSPVCLSLYKLSRGPVLVSAGDSTDARVLGTLTSLSLMPKEEGEGLSWILLQRTHRELLAGVAGGRFQPGERRCFPAIRCSADWNPLVPQRLPHTKRVRGKSEWPLVGKDFQHELGGRDQKKRVQL